jgi:hypothetical protein
MLVGVVASSNHSVDGTGTRLLDDVNQLVTKKRAAGRGGGIELRRAEEDMVPDRERARLKGRSCVRRGRIRVDAKGGEIVTQLGL